MGNLYLHTLNTAGISGSKEKESCGSHYREDSPDTDDAHYLHRISIGLEEKIKRFYTECWGVLKSTLPTFFSL